MFEVFRIFYENEIKQLNDGGESGKKYDDRFKRKNKQTNITPFKNKPTNWYDEITIHWLPIFNL